MRKMNKKITKKMLDALYGILVDDGFNALQEICPFANLGIEEICFKCSSLMGTLPYNDIYQPEFFECPCHYYNNRDVVIRETKKVLTKHGYDISIINWG